MKPGTRKLLDFCAHLLHERDLREPDIRQAYYVPSDDPNDEWQLMTFNMALFFELPMIFEQWGYYEPADEVGLIGSNKWLGMTGMIKSFFRINQEEFMHLFDCKGGNQNTAKFGGRELNLQSKPIDVAFNILEFIESRHRVSK